MKNILIIGATGTLGRATTETLLRNTDDRLTLFSRSAGPAATWAATRRSARTARRPTSSSPRTWTTRSSVPAGSRTDRS
ncbi:KR domain-containing protein [Bifidobacterium cuniculi]|uniref:KR domain-containing protein n=1 Tax=Bifidobacterium cuniculi TaxID=1688 RepID=UPI001EF9E725|nr:KR domain-containing protein [Bifidobacterium cuniculi]